MNVLRIIDTFLMIALAVLILTGAAKPEHTQENMILDADYEQEELSLRPEENPVLCYMGQASIRVVTPENKVIYIDPYAGDAYDLPADLILVTHDHFDHCAVERVKNQSEDCRIITQAEALEDGKHQSFELPFVTVEAVEAGYNRWHDPRECVGYVLTFTNGVSLYVTGDTSTTKQTAEMSDHGEMFDRELAEQFAAPNRLIVYPGEELELK